MFDFQIVKNLFIYLPLSVIGIWRWSFWLVRRVSGAFYRPNSKAWEQPAQRMSVSVVTPVYNEDPVIFERAMQSWIKNGVDEIVAVIDKSNTRHIIEYSRKYLNNPKYKTICRLIVTPKPGKRAALCDGIETARSDIIALVDSDTVWSDDVLKKSVPFFANPRIGGTTVTQRILNADTLANIMFDILLWSRYKEEVPFLMATGKVVNTLSGRTAFYRKEALLNSNYDNIHNLRHEFFLGTRGISGDDKRLTHLIIEQGWHTAYVPDAVVYTPGLNSIKKFLKQRLRWTRNSWRADLRAVKKGWVWSHPALAIFMIDRFFVPIFMLIGPVVMAFAIIQKEWLFVGILLAWWILSRFIKIFGYFRAHPKRIVYLPAYILYGYINAIIKIYALATLIENSWATRWNKSRAKRKSYFRKTYTILSGAAAIFIFMFSVAELVSSLRQQTGANIPTPAAVDQSAFQAQVSNVSQLQKYPPIPQGLVDPTTVETYTVKPGDSLDKLSQQFGMSVRDLKRLNQLRDEDKINEGQTLLYYKGTIR